MLQTGNHWLIGTMDIGYRDNAGDIFKLPLTGCRCRGQRQLCAKHPQEKMNMLMQCGLFPTKISVSSRFALN